MEKSAEESTMTRLYRCLDIFSNVRLPTEARQWTEDNWEDFFAGWLVDFRRWQGGRQDLSRFLGNNLSQSQEWWNDRGFEGVENPALAAKWIHTVPKEIEIRENNIIPEEIISTMIIEGIPPIDTADPHFLQRMQQLNERVRRASDQSRTVVSIGTAPNSTGIVFVPLFNKDTQGAIPFACLMTGVKSSLSIEERIRHDLAARALLSTLLFFEGLRLMVAFGCGVRCPIRSIVWAQRAWARMQGDKLPACCGRNKELIALWEAGNKAKDMGLFSPHKWDRPHECM